MQEVKSLLMFHYVIYIYVYIYIYIFYIYIYIVTTRAINI
jgi:hypothetical protein